MAVRKEYDVGILMSTDTDLKPALETVAQLTTSTGPRPEAAAWREKDLRDRRLSIGTRNLWCHWLDETTYTAVADATDCKPTHSMPAPPTAGPPRHLA